VRACTARACQSCVAPTGRRQLGPAQVEMSSDKSPLSRTVVSSVPRECARVRIFGDVPVIRTCVRVVWDRKNISKWWLILDAYTNAQ
jgi:hypothetical protein